MSNPGCYPTGFIGLIRPLVKAGLVPASYPVTVNAVSGYSGGGKAMIAEFETAPKKQRGRRDRLSRLWPDAEAQACAGNDQTRGSEPGTSYSRPPSAPIARGCWSRFRCIWGRCRKRPSVERLHGALVEAYDGQRFVEVADLEETEAMTGIEPEGLNGSNRLRLHVFGDRNGEQARLVALLDNLGKGASGAAVQNLNIMLGLGRGDGPDLSR